MALRTPPSWLQNGSHPAENDRLSMQSIIATSGIIGTSSLAVTQPSAPGLAVQVAAGWGAIVGDYQTNMGVYQFYNDAATQLSVTTASVSLPRIDKVVVTINDSYYTGATNNVTFTVVAGTPASSPVAPATPTNSLSLATIAVAAGATSILNANITDTRVSITTNLPVGDLTEVAAGTGITVTSGTGPIPSVALTTPVAVANGGTGITSFGTGVATFLGTPSSANLATAITDETGTGSLVFGTSPTITPAAGTTSTGATGAGYMGLPQNTTTTGAATIAAADAGKHIYSTATRTLTIDSNANLALPIGTTITFIAGSGATVTISITTDTMYLAGSGTTGSRTLAAFGMATAVKIASTTWIISGNGLT